MFEWIDEISEYSEYETTSALQKQIVVLSAEIQGLSSSISVTHDINIIRALELEKSVLSAKLGGLRTALDKLIDDKKTIESQLREQRANQYYSGGGPGDLPPEPSRGPDFESDANEWDF